MKRKEKAAVSSHGHHETKEEKSLARPDELEDLPYFLAGPPEDPEDAARALFPGRGIADRLSRAALLDVAAAGADSAAAATWLEKARGLMSRELQNGDSGPTVTEDALTAARDRRREALWAVSRTFTRIRRVRQLLPRPRRRLRIVS